MNIRLKTGGLVAVCVVMLAVVGVAAAQTATPNVSTTVTLLTPYTWTDVPVYWDSNKDNVNDETEFVGTYNAFDIHEPLTFTWVPYTDEKVDPAKLSYRITVWQIGPWAIFSGWIDLNNPATLSLEDDDYAILRTEHHWATNPNTLYTIAFNPFDDNEWVCDYCPTRIVVQPELYTQYFNPLTGVYEYQYKLIENAPMQWSDLFVIRHP